MPSRIDIFTNTNKNINFISRTKTYGAEFNMVDRYINYIIKTNRKTKTHMAIFIEPQLDFGYPDIVVVEYSDPIKDIWVPERNMLDNIDIKILFEIHRLNLANIDDIVFLLGHSHKEVQQHLAKLEQAALLTVNSNKIKKLSLNKYCTIKKIISIEAKLDKWNDVINQAQNSYLFATEVFLQHFLIVNLL